MSMKESTHHRQVVQGIVTASMVVVMLILAWLPGFSLAYGQDGEDQTEEAADAGQIYSHGIELLYPVTIRFFLTVSCPQAMLNNVELTVRQESGLYLSFDVSVADHIGEESRDYTNLIYDWVLADSEQTPLPFESLNYGWRVETAEGVSSVADEILLEDTRHGEWYKGGEPPLTLRWLNPDLAGGRIQKETLAAYDLLTRRTGLSPRFEFVIYDPGMKLCESRVQETGETASVLISHNFGQPQYACSLEHYKQAYDHANMLFLQRTSLGYAVLEDELITEMAQKTYDQLWAGAEVPAWFRFGLAGLYRLRPNYSALQVVRTAARTETLITLPELAQPLPSTTQFQAQMLWESESYLLVLFLADKFGAQAPFELAQAVTQHAGGFAGALQDLIGAGDAALWDEWTTWIFTNNADAAQTWTPYLLTTPTPTATPTATRIPPSRTPTPTATATPTATSTFIGAQPPTPVVMSQGPVTPTLRPTKPPLPPGSLPTATMSPVPVSEEETDSEDDVSISIGVEAIALGIGVVLLLSFVIWLVLRRQ